MRSCLKLIVRALIKHQTVCICLQRKQGSKQNKQTKKLTCLWGSLAPNNTTAARELHLRRKARGNASRNNTSLFPDPETRALGSFVSCGKDLLLLSLFLTHLPWPNLMNQQLAEDIRERHGQNTREKHIQKSWRNTCMSC